ncbi:unnamed protein product [Lactuca virosa]|uniref:F-box domain-containing protein n=1 Tax=Lactuca virosa TaxID=75947 RepID=A0AAU9NZD2_9ASTR|nr:unnamed protein product [Lactuca virosa]
MELPYDVIANILYRVGVYDILENAQKVCTTWHKICKDPAMWRVINMENNFKDVNRNGRSLMQEMCKHAVDRSQDQLIDITVCDFANKELLEYIADRSSQLRRLELAFCYGRFCPMLTTRKINYDLVWHCGDGIATAIGENLPKLKHLELSGHIMSNNRLQAILDGCPKLELLDLR